MDAQTERLDDQQHRVARFRSAPTNLTAVPRADDQSNPGAEYDKQLKHWKNERFTDDEDTQEERLSVTSRLRVLFGLLLLSAIAQVLLVRWIVSFFR